MSRYFGILGCCGILFQGTSFTFLRYTFFKVFLEYIYVGWIDGIKKGLTNTIFSSGALLEASMEAFSFFVPHGKSGN